MAETTVGMPPGPVKPSGERVWSAGDGGAWSIPSEAREAHAAGCLAAAERGFAVLQSSGSALDAVVAAVELLEDDPTFDAGRGTVLSAEGRVQLDAGLMDGRTLQVGAVANVHRVAHPIRLARVVLERSRHHLLVGEGAERFAREQGLSLVEPDTFVVERGLIVLDRQGEVGLAHSTCAWRTPTAGRACPPRWAGPR